MEQEVKVISKEDLDNLKNGSQLVGILLLQSYQKATTSNGKPYFTGTLQSGTSVSFKCWNSSNAFTKLDTENYSGMVVCVRCDVDEYKGSISLILKDVVAVEGYDISLFLKKRYDTNAYLEGLRVNFVDKYLSQKGKDIFNKIFTPDVVSKFMTEFAASGHHDNCVGGLLAHTYKVAMFGELVIKLYPRFFMKEGTNEISQDRIDLFMLGILLHDVGKIMEMNNGVYQPCSRVTHRVLGLLMIQDCRQDIINAYGDIGYYDLVSVLIQHHDEFDDKARTVLAKLVYYCDITESRCMGLAQELEEKVQGVGGDARVYFDGSYLYV